MATELRAQLGDSCFVRTLVAKPVPQAESQGDAANEARSRSILLTGVPTLASLPLALAWWRKADRASWSS